MVKVIGIGDSMVDKNLTNGMMYPGGQALNIAVNTKLCGAQSAFIGAFGDDYIADHMKKTMDEIGLDYSHSHFYHAPNAFARYKVIDNDRVFQRSPNGRYNPMQGAIRRMLAYEGFSKEDIEYIKGFDVMHTSNGAFIEEYLPELAAQGINTIGIPGTIDLDISCTDYTIGFDTALNTAVEAIDRLRDTSESHDRCSVVEVMGHGAGHLALYASVACGGTACWVNEIGFDVDRDVIEKINSSIRTGKHNFIVIVSEGITDVHHLARYIEEKTGVESRATVLGHIQRGGTPTARDRIIASQMGCYAVDLLEQGIGNRVVIQKNAKIIDYDILEALTMKKGLDRGLLEVNQIINI